MTLDELMRMEIETRAMRVRGRAPFGLVKFWDDSRKALPLLLEVANKAKALRTKYEVDGEAACEMEIAALFAAVEKMEGM